ncbi:hypothetical protein AVEN_259558-1 [Araneus ventricosus]|uniref:DUF4371 domain-containing protein n=1 Tax=Araneus ventricosus TaxID=182803 RepID=A0A4Y2ERP5_ARAVE|nr:hypothetical protein AVEN_259558-1 [Araneus ventricosus]
MKTYYSYFFRINRNDDCELDMTGMRDTNLGKSKFVFVVNGQFAISENQTKAIFPYPTVEVDGRKVLLFQEAKACRIPSSNARGVSRDLLSALPNPSGVKVQELHTSFHCLGVTWEDTLEIEKLNSKQFRRTINEEHYSILQQPGSVLIGRVALSSGSAQNIVNSILSYLNETGFLLHELYVIGCDGTVTNTGWKTGVISQIEKQVKRPLQLGVCLLHFNELPFRHLFINLDDETTAPKSFSGPSGTQLSKCEKLPVVNFKSNECEISEIERKILSKDQQHLLDISYAVKSGSSPEDLSVREPGSLSHSR